MVRHDWILRRVDTIHFLDGVQLERRVTLDLDLHALRSEAKIHRVREPSVPVPLMTLVKEPIIELDVKTSLGDSVAIATSDQNSHLTNALLLTILNRHGINPRGLPPTVLQHLYSIVRAPSNERLLSIMYAVSPGAFDVPPNDALIAMKSHDRLVWERMLEVGEFFENLIDFARSFILVGQIGLPPAGDVAVLKVRLIEERSSSEQTSLLSPDRLGWRPLVQTIPLGGLGKAQRNHIKIFAPEDSVVRHAKIVDDKSTIKEVRDGTIGKKRAPLDRVAFYHAHLPARVYGATVELEPTRSPFLVPAAITTALLGLLLAAAAFLQWTDERFSDHPASFLLRPEPSIGWLAESVTANHANFDAAVTVLALVPSLVAIYLVRTGEHRLVTRLMVVPRILVLLSALSAIVAAGATAASIEPVRLAWIYSVAAALSGGAFLTVIVPLVRITLFRIRRRWRTRERKSR